MTTDNHPLCIAPSSLSKSSRDSLGTQQKPPQSTLQNTMRVFEVLDDGEVVMPIDPVLLNMENYAVANFNYTAPDSAKNFSSTGGHEAPQSDWSTINDNHIDLDMLDMFDEVLNNCAPPTLSPRLHPYFEQGREQQQREPQQHASARDDGMSDTIVVRSSRSSDDNPDVSFLYATTLAEATEDTTTPATPSSYNWQPAQPSSGSSTNPQHHRARPQQTLARGTTRSGSSARNFSSSSSSSTTEDQGRGRGRGRRRRRRTSPPALDPSSYYIAFRASYPTIAREHSLTPEEWGAFKECAKQFFLEHDAGKLWVRAGQEEWGGMVRDFTERFAERIFCPGATTAASAGGSRGGKASKRGGNNGGGGRGSSGGRSSRGRGKAGRNWCGGRDYDRVIRCFSATLKAVRRGFRESVTRQTKKMMAESSKA